MNTGKRSNPAPCRSELAREKPEGNAGRQVPRVSVNDLREQARSYKGLWAGAVANRFRQALQPRRCRSELAREKPEGDAGRQVPRVIVNDLREQARSYTGLLPIGLPQP